MINYPATLPTPLLSSGGGGSTSSVMAIKFDYKRRTVRMPNERLQVGVNFSYSDTELTEFLDNFYDVVAKTWNFVFLADWYISANDNVDKTLRIISQPIIKPIASFRYNVSFNIEVLSFGTAKINERPLLPYNTLYPSDTLLIG